MHCLTSLLHAVAAAYPPLQGGGGGRTLTVTEVRCWLNRDHGCTAPLWMLVIALWMHWSITYVIRTCRWFSRDWPIDRCSITRLYHYIRKWTKKSQMRPGHPHRSVAAILGIWSKVANIVTHPKSRNDQFTGFSSTVGRKSQFSYT